MYYVSIILCLNTWWSSPINLGIPGFDDVNPQTCRQLYYGHPVCLVWQVYHNNNWDLFSRFSISYPPGWGDTIRVTTDNGDDINPALAHHFIVYYEGRSWCVWQNNSEGNWDIYITYSELWSNVWAVPYQLTADSIDEENPAVAVIRDTVWVVWQASDDSVINIISCYYDGVSWSPLIPITNDSMYNNTNPKIGYSYQYPFVVWERTGDIYYSEYKDGNWQTPQPIAPDPATDTSPDITMCGIDYPVWVTWQSNRDGNWNIYITGSDSLDIYRCLTFSDSSDISPSPLYFDFFGPLRYYCPPGVAFTSNRNGNYDIYTFLYDQSYWPPHDTLCCIDTDSALDIDPVLCGAGFNAWVIWQTDRNNEWDIYGSWIRTNAIEENYRLQTTLSPVFVVAPNPFSEMTEIRFPKYYSGIKPEKTGYGANTVNAKTSLEVYNTDGILVKKFGSVNYNSSLPVLIWHGDDNASQKLPAGVYFLVYCMDSNSFVTKVVKVK